MVFKKKHTVQMITNPSLQSFKDWWTPFNITIVAYSLDIIATIILTIHVLLIHEKLQVSSDGNSVEIVLNDREHIERALIITAVALYLISFVMFLWALFKSKQENEVRLSQLENRKDVAYNNTMISPTSFI